MPCCLSRRWSGVYAAVRLVLPFASGLDAASLGLVSLITAVYAAGMAIVQEDGAAVLRLPVHQSCLAGAGGTANCIPSSIADRARFACGFRSCFRWAVSA